MISELRGRSKALRKTVPLRRCQHVYRLWSSPGSGSYWYHSQYGWRLVSPIVWDLHYPLAITSPCPLVDSCSLLLERATDYFLLCRPRNPVCTKSSTHWGLLIHTVAWSHRTRCCWYVTQKRGWMTSVFFHRRASICASTFPTLLSFFFPSSPPFPALSLSDESWFIGDLNGIYFHLITRLTESKTSCSIFDWPDVLWLRASWWCCSVMSCGSKPGQFSDLLWLWTWQSCYMNSVSTLLHQIYQAILSFLFAALLFLSPLTAAGIQRNINRCCLYIKEGKQVKKQLG